ncbi:MAG: T9SS type A sorting domain-containing protein [Fluviicola sp.]
MDLEIINSEGKTVELKSHVQPNENISIEHLLAGNYILLIRQNGRTVTKKNLIKS